jgi:hypothetical protein
MSSCLLFLLICAYCSCGCYTLAKGIFQGFDLLNVSFDVN